MDKRVVVFDIDDTIIGLLKETFRVLDIPLSKFNDLRDYRVSKDPFWTQFNLGPNLEKLFTAWATPTTYLNSKPNKGYEKINILKNMGHTIIFHSMCINEETANAKKQIIHNLYPWVTEDNFRMDIKVKKALDIKPDYFVENDVLFLSVSGAKKKVLIDFSYNRPVNTGMQDKEYGIQRVKDLDAAIDYIISDIKKNSLESNSKNDNILFCEYLISKISKYLPKSMYMYRIAYFGRALEVISKDESEDTRLYIRIIPVNNNKYTVDMSNIVLDSKLRGNGLFRQLVTDLKKSRKGELCEVWVSSVLTPEMHKACKAVGMDKFEPISGYKYTIHKQ